MTLQEQALAKALQDPNLFVTTVTAILYSKYGTEYFEWDPVVVSQQIQMDFGFEPDQRLQDKVHTAISLFVNPGAFFTDLQVFGQMCNVMAHEDIDSTQFTPPDADDCAWGCLEAKLLLGQDYLGTYSDNVAAYVGYLLENEGMSTPPNILKFAKYPSGKPEVSLDDEMFYKAWWDTQEAKVDEFEVGLNARFVELLKQIKALPIKGEFDTQFIDKMLERFEQINAKQSL